MSLLLAGGVALGYATAVIGLHRLNVHRMRTAAGGFPTLAWLDWDTLLEGLVPDGIDSAQPPPSPVLGGGPPPAALSRGPGDNRRAALLELVQGERVPEERFSSAGFSGGQLEWLLTLSHLAPEPSRALALLESRAPDTAAELYLREHLRLSSRVHAANLELQVFSTKRRLGLGLARFGEHPSLFYARAHASALLGFNSSAIDDLARAVYFSRQATFYLRAVTSSPYIEEVRPALAQQCRLALDPGPKLE
ncbi:MAG: hypothetical protein HYZ28_12785 [Myxococcales bacterium]|nr:hypothetical protein [Myxococcales bacterium]